MPIVRVPYYQVVWFFYIRDPQANKLSTVKRCLNEVLKYGGPFSPRDLYPVRSKFAFSFYLVAHC